MRAQLPFALIAATLMCLLFTAPAHAQRARVFVASYGNDSNPCTFGSPCKTFQQAVNVVAAGGEVTAIDSAGFGPINITKAVTITSPDGVEAGIVPNPGSNAITINTAGDVFLRGLTLEGANSGYDGISLTNADTVGIVHCVIRHFTHDGIALLPNGNLTLSILNTIASNNGNDGVTITPQTSGTTATGVIDHATTSNNANGTGIYVTSATGDAFITIINSVSANNLNYGVSTYSAGPVLDVTVRDTVTAHNGLGFFADGKSSMTFAHSTADGNGNDVYINTSATGISYGDNHFAAKVVSGTLVHQTLF
jgi:hypothetical protein